MFQSIPFAVVETSCATQFIAFGDSSQLIYSFDQLNVGMRMKSRYLRSTAFGILVTHVEQDPVLFRLTQTAKVTLLLRIYSVVAGLPPGADGGPVLLQFYIGKLPCKNHLIARIENRGDTGRPYLWQIHSLISILILLPPADDLSSAQ
jgi:hypothetical protein